MLVVHRESHERAARAQRAVLSLSFHGKHIGTLVVGLCAVEEQDESIDDSGQAMDDDRLDDVTTITTTSSEDEFACARAPASSRNEFNSPFNSSPGPRLNGCNSTNMS